MNKKGDLKLRVLRAIRDGFDTCAAIADRIGCDRKLLSSTLVAYSRAGLIETSSFIPAKGSGGRPASVYVLTSAGEAFASEPLEEGPDWIAPVFRAWLTSSGFSTPLGIPELALRANA